MRFEVFTAVKMCIVVYSFVGGHQRFGGMNFYPEDGGDKFLRNVGNHLRDYIIAPQLRLQSAQNKNILH
jgi:hypothetical protein